MKKIKLIIIGAGSRGTGYAQYALEHPEQAQIVGVAEPRKAYRNLLAEKHGIAARYVSKDWKELAGLRKFADAVIIATPDSLHTEPAITFAKKGYHILLEKPMASTELECRRIVETVRTTGCIFAVCHVLRYTAFTRRLKKLIDSGLIGDVVNIQRLEPVGYWHYAHSFVRGNWRNETETSSMLLAKCCHDLDWIRYVMAVPCTAVHSFGSLRHFIANEKPEGAADHCLDCPVEAECPYSAKKIYSRFLEQGRTGWPLDVLSVHPTKETIMEALRTGLYGRCVYACDNDVVDNQVVNLQFEGGRTASLTMIAFSEATARQTRIFGTRGELACDGSVIRHYDFLTETHQEIPCTARNSPIPGGHGGGDYALMQSFVKAVADNNPSYILSGATETLETHRMVFAAETSRKEARVVHMDQFPTIGNSGSVFSKD